MFLIMDGVEDIFRKYLGMRVEVLREHGIESREMFPPLKGNVEFYCQQSFGRLKKVVEDIRGTRFELRSGRRAFGQRLLDKGNLIEDVSVAMGHASTKTIEGYYARGREDIVMNRICRASAVRRCPEAVGNGPICMGKDSSRNLPYAWIQSPKVGTNRKTIASESNCLDRRVGLPGFEPGSMAPKATSIPS